MQILGYTISDFTTSCVISHFQLCFKVSYVANTLVWDKLQTDIFKLVEGKTVVGEKAGNIKLPDH